MRRVTKVPAMSNPFAREELFRGLRVGPGAIVVGEIVRPHADIAREVEAAEHHRLLVLDAGVVVVVVVAGIEVLELDPVEAADGAVGAGIDEEILLGAGDLEDVDDLAAGVAERGLTMSVAAGSAGETRVSPWTWRVGAVCAARADARQNRAGAANRIGVM